MSKAKVFRGALAIVVVGGIFAYTISSAETLTVSNYFGMLAFSIAVGSIVFFAITSPFGTRSSIVVFGREQEYLARVSEIPRRIVVLILSVILFCCVSSFGFYYYGY